MFPLGLGSVTDHPTPTTAQPNKAKATDTGTSAPGWATWWNMSMVPNSKTPHEKHNKPVGEQGVDQEKSLEGEEEPSNYVMVSEAVEQIAATTPSSSSKTSIPTTVGSSIMWCSCLVHTQPGTCYITADAVYVSYGYTFTSLYTPFATHPYKDGYDLRYCTACEVVARGKAGGNTTSATTNTSSMTAMGVHGNGEITDGNGSNGNAANLMSSLSLSFSGSGTHMGSLAKGQTLVIAPLYYDVHKLHMVISHLRDMALTG